MSLLPLAPPSSERTHPSPLSASGVSTQPRGCWYPGAHVHVPPACCARCHLEKQPQVCALAHPPQGCRFGLHQPWGKPGWQEGSWLVCHLNSIPGVSTIQRGSLVQQMWGQGVPEQQMWLLASGKYLGSSSRAMKFSTSKSWRWSGVRLGLWSVIKSARPSLVPCGSLCSRRRTRMGQCHQRGWRVAPGTEPWWHYPSLAPAKHRMMAPHVSQGAIELLAPLCSGC